MWPLQETPGDTARPRTVLADTVTSAFTARLGFALLLGIGAAVSGLAWDAAVQSLRGLPTLIAGLLV